MGTPIGSLGGIALSPETTWGETGTPVWVWQHPMESSFGYRREVIEPNVLSYAAHTARGYSGGYADGDIVMGLDLNDPVIGLALSLAGNKAGNVYNFGLNSPPDQNSCSALINYDGGGDDKTQAHEWVYAGVKPNALRFDLVPDSNSSLTLVGTAPTVVKTALGSAIAPLPPVETNLFMPSDLGTVLIDGNQVCLYSGTVEVLVPKTGFERRCMGGNMKEQIPNGRPDLTFNLNLSLDDATNNDTISVLADFVAGDHLGNIQLGDDILLTNCLMGGDFPGLQEGEIDFTISGTCTVVGVTTVPLP